MKRSKTWSYGYSSGNTQWKEVLFLPTEFGELIRMVGRVRRIFHAQKQHTCKGMEPWKYLRNVPGAANVVCSTSNKEKRSQIQVRKEHEAGDF